MLGFAQRHFLEKGGELFSRRPVFWPFLQKLLSQGFLHYIDYAIASKLLEDNPDAEAAAACICHLSIATRNGHLCIGIKDAVQPAPETCWISGDEKKSLSEEDLNQLNALIMKGSQQLSHAILADVSQGNPMKPLCMKGDFFYFQRYWLSEVEMLKHLQRIEESPPSLILDLSLVQKKLATLPLLPEQVDAILTACQSSITLLCGGPGTGKTYTAGQLVKVFWEGLTPEKRKECKIALAAPTGKAAINLQKSLEKAIGQQNDFPKIKAMTIHALLGVKGKGTQNVEEGSLAADLVLVDESSMVDIQLMASLLASVKPGARVILLGDKYQLPPVGVGAPFSDLLRYFQNKGSHQAIELKKCLRAELTTIVDFATAINRGDAKTVFQIMKNDSSGISLKQCQGNRMFQQQLLDYVFPFFSSVNHDAPSEFLASYSRFRILSPLRQGHFGVDVLNFQLLQKMVKMTRGEQMISPIMIVANDYKMELFNGDVGVLVQRRQSHDGDLSIGVGDYALFPGGESAGIRRFPALLLPKYEYSYCMSVHKSQGSEFDHVVLLLPEGSEVFGREVLYTAVTRARKKLEIWGTEAVMCKTMERQVNRLSSSRP